MMTRTMRTNALTHRGECCHPVSGVGYGTVSCRSCVCRCYFPSLCPWIPFPLVPIIRSMVPSRRHHAASNTVCDSHPRRRHDRWVTRQTRAPKVNNRRPAVRCGNKVAKPTTKYTLSDTLDTVSKSEPATDIIPVWVSADAATKFPQNSELPKVGMFSCLLVGSW